MRKRNKTILIAAGSIILVILLVQWAFNSAYIQNKLKNLVEGMAEEQLQAEVTVGRFRWGFPKTLKVQEVLIKNQDTDSLLSFTELSVTLRMFPLLKKNVVLQHVSIMGLKSQIDHLLNALPADSTSANVTPEPTDEPTSWTVTAEKLSVETSYIAYYSKDVGMNLVVDVGELKLHLGTLNLDSFISITSVDIQNTHVVFRSYAVEDADTIPSSFAKILLEDASLLHSSFVYVAEDSTLVLDAGGTSLAINDFLLDLDRSSIHLNKGKSVDFHCDLRMDEAKDTTIADSGDMNWGASLWRISGNELDLEGFRFAMEDVLVPEQPGHFDPSHLRFEELTGQLSDFVINTDTLIVSIDNFSGKEHHGLDIQKISADFNQQDSVFFIKNMQIKTGASAYQAKLETTINPTNYNDLNGKTLSLNLDVNAENWHDIDYFYPLLQAMDFITPRYLQSPFALKTKVTGKLEHLEIPSFNFTTLESTQVDFSGNLQNLMSDNGMAVQIKLNELSTSKKDVRHAIKDFPADFNGYSIPKTVHVNGDYTMVQEQHSFAGKLMSSAGNVDFKKVKIDVGDEPSYVLNLLANLDHLSEINEDWEKAVFQVDAAYHGKDIWSSKSDLKLNVDSIRYLQQTYQQLALNAQMDTGFYHLNFLSADSSLHLKTFARGKMTEKLKSVTIDADIKNLDVHLFNPDADSLRMAGAFHLDGHVKDEQEMLANLQIEKLSFYFKDSVYALKPATFEFATDTGFTHLDIESYFYNLDFKASSNVSDLISAFSHLPQYYLSTTIDTVPFLLPEFELNGKLEYPQAFASHFLAGYPAFDVLNIRGKHVKADDQFFIDASVHKTIINNLELDGANLHMDGSSKEMKVTAFTKIKLGENLKGEVHATGDFKESELFANLVFNDAYGDEYLNFSTQVDTIDNSILVHIIPDSLKLGYTPWTIDANNKLIFSKSGIDLKNIELKRNQQTILLRQDSAMRKTDIELVMSNVNIGNTGRLFEMDTVVSGIVNANIKVKNMQTNLVLSGNMGIDKTTVYSMDIGKVQLSDFLYNDTLLSVDLLLEGGNQVVHVNGELRSMKEIDALVDIQTLKLSALNYYLPEEIQNAKGSIAGNLKVTGSTVLPMLNGFLQFSEAGLKVLSVNQYFSLGNDKIVVENNVLKFNDFSIVNDKKQSATVNGEISLITGNKVYNNLWVKTDNMEWINSTQKQNKLLFGMLKAQSTVQIKGPSAAFKVKAKVVVDKSTNLTYVFPDKLTINDNKGIVSFSPYVDDTTALPDVDESNAYWGLGNFNDVETRLEIQQGTHFKLFFDETGENNLDANLSGVLNYFVKGRNNEISGVFEINRGQLHYSIPMVTVDDFELEPGSSITLSNDMYNPYLNIIASSKIRASTEGLMIDYKKVMTFKVLLYMQGELNNMKLRFDISQETGDAMVSSAIAQLSEKERNVNALNLLVSGAFKLSLQGAGAGGTSAAQAQLDKLYSDGLNSLVADNIKFVDLQFDVQSFEDYGTGESQVFRRNYYYEVGKSFFKDRARVNYKGRLEMMDNKSVENVNSSFVQNQLEVEVKINKEGNLNAVFFRKDEYEGLLEGQVIETGLGMRITKSFYSIKDIFVNEDNKKAKEYRDKRMNNDE